MERMLMDCCVGCRNYQKCRVCRFEDDVACAYVDPYHYEVNFLPEMFDPVTIISEN